jgi:hypothetical protein
MDFDESVRYFSWFMRPFFALILLLFLSPNVHAAAHPVLMQALAGMKAHQFILLTLYSKMTAGEAEKEFGGVIPPERILSRVDGTGNPLLALAKLASGVKESSTDIVKIARGFMFAVRGYQLIEGAQGSDLLPLDLPYEFAMKQGKFDIDLKRPLDRRNIKAVVEFGRAHAEGTPLRGNLVTATKVMTQILNNEADVLGIPQDQFAIVAHSRDAGHLRFFLLNFPGRPLNPQRQLAFEDNPKSYLESYLNRPLPETPEEWKAYDKDTIILGSLEAFSRRFCPEQNSNLVYKMRQVSQWDISAQQIRTWTREVSTIMRENFDYAGQNRGPILVTDWGSPLMEIKAAKALAKIGKRFHTDDFKAMDAVAQAVQKFMVPDMGKSDWVEKSMFIPSTAADMKKTAPHVAILSNLDPALAKADPVHYIAGVLMAYVDHIRLELLALNEDERARVYQLVSEERVILKLPPITPFELDELTYFEAFPFFVGSTDDGILNQMAQFLTQRTMKGHVARFDVDSRQLKSKDEKWSAQLGQQDCPLLGFGSKEIERIRKLLPDTNVKAAQRLRPGIHHEKNRLLQVGYL